MGAKISCVEGRFDSNVRDDFKYEMELKGCVFVGHINTDLDSIAGAIAAADLFGGIPASASAINTECEFALKRWGFECPPLFETIPGVQDMGVCLVDFNQRSQMTNGLKESQIRGIIDHHALRDGSVSTGAPIYMDIRPWGSVSTILAHTYFRNKKQVPKKIAGLLLSAILSDTLNRNSPTCTDLDRTIAARLAEYAGVKDINALANEQFKAKAQILLRHPISTILRMDLKRFNIAGFNLVFAVCETPDVSVLLEKREHLLQEMDSLKSEGMDDLVFFAMINIVDLKSQLLILGEAEQDLAEKAFSTEMESKTQLMDLGGRVSRKKTMVPPIDAILKSGWKMPKTGGVRNSPSDNDLCAKALPKGFMAA